MLEPGRPHPIQMAQAEFEAVWDGRLLMMTTRASLTDLSSRFDITWFLGAIHKYKPAAWRGPARLVLPSALCVGLAAVFPGGRRQGARASQLEHPRGSCDRIWLRSPLFETILGILRTYLFSHTTNRIDVELGARLFRHLLALPIGYFQARRVGDLVARVRELENIRNFLTSSGLTLVIDLFFTSIFIAVTVLLFAAADLDRPRLLPVLYRDIRSCDAAVPAAPGREVQARRRKSGLPGRERVRNRDAQGHGS